LFIPNQSFGIVLFTSVESGKLSISTSANRQKAHKLKIIKPGNNRRCEVQITAGKEAVRHVAFVYIGDFVIEKDFVYVMCYVIMFSLIKKDSFVPLSVQCNV
jgi:hypothetical protein